MPWSLPVNNIFTLCGLILSSRWPVASGMVLLAAALAGTGSSFHQESSRVARMASAAVTTWPNRCSRWAARLQTARRPIAGGGDHRPYNENSDPLFGLCWPLVLAVSCCRKSAAAVCRAASDIRANRNRPSLIRCRAKKVILAVGILLMRFSQIFLYGEHRAAITPFI